MATVVCHTPGCPAQDEAVSGVVVTWEDEDGATHPVDAVICGACSQPTTDVTP
jgi:hypothetical protein